MDDEQLLRYSRQIMLPQVGVEGQQRLLDARALIVGLGGLGSPAAMYLAAAGVGHLVLVDGDCVDLSNLQRQIIHTTEDLGRPKVHSARETVRALNPQVEAGAIETRLDRTQLLEQVRQCDVVLDASDNFATRFAVNDACVQAGVALVSGAAIRMEGQVAVFLPGREESSPCYRCLYKDQGELEETCSDNGILAPLAGIVGSIQAMEAMKVLMGLGDPLCGRLLLLDAHTMEWRTLRLPKDPRCPMCATPAALCDGA